MKVVAIIQARMGSERLPGKVMMDIAGKPMLVRVVERVSLAQQIEQVVVATTVKKEDDVLAELCQQKDWIVYRGSEDDVLDRYYQAAKQYQADVIVRITADCPLIDPGVIDQCIKKFLNEQPQVDYLANFLPKRTYPRGLDVEVTKFSALEQAWLNAIDQPYREHVTYYIENHPDRFQLSGLENDTDYAHLRWTVDEQADLDLVRLIYKHVNDRFIWTDVLALLERYPEWVKVNEHVKQKLV